MKRFLIAFVAAALCLSVAQVASAKSAVPSQIVYFSVGQSKLSPTAKATLIVLAKKLSTSDTVDLRGYVQHSSTTKNDVSLATSRAANVKAYLIALGVKAKITSKGYGMPTAHRSRANARRVEIYVVHSTSTPKVSPSPSPSRTSTGSISGMLERNYYYVDCNDLQLNYVKLYQGSTLISTIAAPAWSSTTGNDCIYNYQFQGLSDGTYTVEESFTQVQGYPWNLISVNQPTWTVVGGTPSNALNEVRTSPDQVIVGGGAITGIDLRLFNSD